MINQWEISSKGELEDEPGQNQLLLQLTKCLCSYRQAVAVHEKTNLNRIFYLRHNSPELGYLVKESFASLSSSLMNGMP